MSKLLPYETIVKAHEGDPDAIDTVLSHYAGYIRYFSKVHGQVNAEVEEYVKQQLIAALFKFRFDRQTPKLNTSRPLAVSESSKSEKDLLLFLLSIWQNRKVTRSR